MNNFILHVVYWFGSWSLSDIQMLLDIFQNLTIIFATIFTAWWAYSTFGHKEKTEELLAIAKKIVEIHSHIEGSVLTLKYSTILHEIGGDESIKLDELKKSAKIRLEVLADELDQMQLVSFRVPFVFRVLKIAPYKLDMMMLGDLEHWGDEKVAEKLRMQRVTILVDIEQEINAHRRWLSWVGRKFKNGLFHIKNLAFWSRSSSTT